MAITTPPTKANANRDLFWIRGPFSMTGARRRDHQAERNPPAKTPMISITSHAVHGDPSCRYMLKYAFACAPAGLTARTAPAAALANAPDAPSPRPTIVNAVSNTSPSATPARYGSAYARGECDRQFTASLADV